MINECLYINTPPVWFPVFDAVLNVYFLSCLTDVVILEEGESVAGPESMEFIEECRAPEVSEPLWGNRMTMDL